MILNKTKQSLINWYIDYINEREIYFDYLSEYKTFSSSVLRHSRPILLEYNTVFNFERKGNNREGALTQKNLNEKVAGISLLVKTIKIRKDISFPLQIHTYFHELTHLVCNHNDQYNNEISLSTGQKEYVAEVTAQALLFSFCGGMLVENLPSNDKWDHSKYINNWVNASAFGKEKIKECKRQIQYAYEKISDTLLEKLNIKNS